MKLRAVSAQKTWLFLGLWFTLLGVLHIVAQEGEPSTQASQSKELLMGLLYILILGIYDG